MFEELRQMEEKKEFLKYLFSMPLQPGPVRKEQVCLLVKRHPLSDLKC